MELRKEILFNLECVGRILPEDNDNIDAKYPSYIMKTSMEDYPYILVEDVRSIFEFSVYQCWNCDENGITGGTDKVELTDDYECNIIIQELEDELQYEFNDSLSELFNSDKRKSSKLFRAIKDSKILDYILNPKFSFSKDPNVMPCDVNVAFLLISSEIKKYCDAHNYQYEYIDSEKMSNAFVTPFVNYRQQNIQNSSCTIEIRNGEYMKVDFEYMKKEDHYYESSIIISDATENNNEKDDKIKVHVNTPSEFKDVIKSYLDYLNSEYMK